MALLQQVAVDNSNVLLLGFIYLDNKEVDVSGFDYAALGHFLH